jgi:hypothetical protein
MIPVGMNDNFEDCYDISRQEEFYNSVIILNVITVNGA